VGTPGISPVKAGLETRASADKSYSAGLSSEEQKVLNALTQEQIAEFKRFGDRVSRDTAFVEALSSDDREANEMSSRLATAQARAERADAAYADRLAMAERLSSLRDSGITMSIDLARDPYNLETFRRLTEQYGDSAAALVLMESELARQAPRPNRAFSDGTAMPVSFDEVRAQHLRERESVEFAPDLDGTKRGNDRSVAGTSRSYAAPAAAPLTPAAGGEVSRGAPHVRGAIDAGGAEIRGRTQTSAESFERQHQIDKAPDGTLSSEKSLMRKAGQQVAADAAKTADNAKDLVNNLLKKK
jgi:conjugal transfer mating pair stabilization protein TraG